ncbi:MAG: ammonium transporter [Bacillota bacterium]|nr:ammonium transporter [Bacillota bacterium]
MAGQYDVVISTVWVLLAAFMVFLMHLGFAMVESGFTRAKNTVNILMKNVLTVLIGVVTYYLVGFALMFGESQGGFAGWSYFALNNADRFDAGVPVMAFWVFQAMFAATCATIVSGAVAERVNFRAYLAFAVVMTALIYPIIGHWVWGGGWLAELGFMDFAGSTVVHSVGAWGALTFARMLGPRLGKYGPQGQVVSMPGHSMPLATIGVLLLWFGWFGFNGGSTIDGTTAALADIIAATMMGGAAGGLSAMVLTQLRTGKADAGMTLNGILAGLVGVTAGANVLTIWAALLVGVASGLVMAAAATFIERVLKVDDPVGAISVHGACGVLGTIAVGLFAPEGGLFYGGGWQLLGVQLLGIGVAFLWTALVAVAALAVIGRLMPLRVSKQVELAGLDVAEHAAVAYSGIALPEPGLAPVVGGSPQ